jgi:hypothetical protein
MPGGARPPNCRVYVAVFNRPACATFKHPHIQRQVLAIHATTTYLGRWRPLVDLHQIPTQLLCQPLRFKEEISETQIANLTSPKLVHGFDV